MNAKKQGKCQSGIMEKGQQTSWRKQSQRISRGRLGIPRSLGKSILHDLRWMMRFSYQAKGICSTERILPTLVPVPCRSSERAQLSSAPRRATCTAATLTHEATILGLGGGTWCRGYLLFCGFCGRILGVPTRSDLP